MPPEPQLITVAGAALEVLDLPATGAIGPTGILLLHEGLGSIGLWQDFPARLAAASGRRVVAYSRHGHGHSDPPPFPRTPRFFHEEALELLPELLTAVDLKRPVLVGHSDGASIALVHAAARDVAGLVLIAPHVLVEDVTLREIRRTVDRYQDGDLRRRMAKHHDHVDAAFWGWADVWLDPSFRGWSLEQEAAMLNTATLLIQGEDDPYATLDQIDRIARLAPGPTRKLVVAGGHAPQLDAADEVLEAIVDFVG